MADKGVPMWINLGSIVLVVALVIDFIVVFRTAIGAAH
jgi:hypothetical protein